MNCKAQQTNASEHNPSKAHSSSRPWLAAEPSAFQGGLILLEVIAMQVYKGVKIVSKSLLVSRLIPALMPKTVGRDYFLLAVCSGGSNRGVLIARIVSKKSPWAPQPAPGS